MRIHILALDRVFDTGLSTLLDTLSIANDLAVSANALTRFDLTIVGMRRSIRTSQGFSVPVVSATRCGPPDVVLIPALGAKMPETLRLALERPDVCEAGDLLRQWSKDDVLVGAACTGTFVLADTLLLNDRSATTSWWLAPLFRERYPRVHLEESRMVVSSPGLVTAGAALAHIDLALWLIRQSSPSLAEMTARYLLIEPRTSQAAFAIPDHLAHTDPLVQRFERWARRRLGERFSLSEAASATGTSERTLSRRLKAVLGKSPLSYFQDLRIERAVYLLGTSNDNVDSIAAQVGYADGATLRTLLRRRVGRTVSELRTKARAISNSFNGS